MKTLPLFERLSAVVLAAALILSVSGCQTEDLSFDGMSFRAGQKVTIRADFESVTEPTTKTTLHSDGHVYWNPGDAISVFYGSGDSGGSKFTANIDEDNRVAAFKGNIGAITGLADNASEDLMFWGLYPYDPAASCDGETITTTLNSQQEGMAGTFAPGTAPSLGRASGLLLSFRNIYSGIWFTVTREGFKSATFKSNAGEPVAGRVKVGIGNDGMPYIDKVLSGVNSVTVRAPGGGTFEVGKRYYVLFIPQLLTGGFTFELCSDTEIGTFSITNSINFKRNAISSVDKLDTKCTFNPADIEQGLAGAENLSLTETANCYIVEKAGVYSFDATTIGNGNKGIMAGYHFHTSDATISPAGVRLLWQDKEVVSNITLQNGRVYFNASSEKGNAVIAVTDTSGIILWSWHIWATDKPQEIRLTPATHAYLDRNLGATTVPLELESSAGLLYQWGRKDPFVRTETEFQNPSPLSISDFIKNPRTLYKSGNETWTESPLALWGNPDGMISDASFKTIYDPCPPGYTVPTDGSWSEYDISVTYSDTHRYKNRYDPTIKITKTDSGLIASKDGYSLIYPSVPAITDLNYSHRGYYQNTGSMMILEEGEYFSSHYYAYRYLACSVRCIKEEPNTVFPPSVEIKDATAIKVNDLVLNAQVLNNGNAPLKKVGFYWGLNQSDLTNHVEASLKSDNTFSIHLEGLPNHATIFVKAFAENDFGRSYAALQVVRLKTVTEYSISVLDSLSRFMAKQYNSFGQGYNGEGTIRLYAGEYPGNTMFTYLTSFQGTINSTILSSTTATLGRFGLYYYYRIINKVNSTIDHFIPLAETSDTDIDFYEASLLGFRAYAYTMLVQMYCKNWDSSENGTSFGVPLRVSADADVTQVSSLADVYQQIYSDLDRAIALMKASSKSRNDVDEIDLQTLYAIYARAALNRRDYNKAASYAKLARENHPLMSNSEYNEGFCQSNSEWIWGAHHELVSQWYTLYYYSYQAYIGYNSSASAVRNYPKCISKELFEKIPDTDIRKSLFLNPEGYSYSTTDGVAEASLSSFARIYAGSNGRLGLYANAKVFAYMQFKFAALYQPGGGQQNFFRSAEMVLIEAEADYYLGNESEAQNLLVYLNKESGRDPAYSCNKTGSELLEELKTYRAIELWGEGFNWFDLKRWGDSVSRKSYSEGGNFADRFAGTWSASDRNDFVWIFPDDYLDLIRTGNYD